MTNTWSGGGAAATTRRPGQKRKRQDKDGLATSGSVQETTRARGRRHDGGGLWPHDPPAG